MRGVCRSEPKPPAILPGVNKGCLSARTKTPGGAFQFGDIYQFGCEAFFVQNQSSLQITSLGARLYSVRTHIPGDNFQFKWEAFFCVRGQISWQNSPMCLRGVIQSEPKPLAIVASLNARSLSARTKIPGDNYHSKCGVYVRQNQNPQKYFPI